MNEAANKSANVKVKLSKLHYKADKDIPGSAIDVMVRAMGLPCAKVVFEGLNSEQLRNAVSILRNEDKDGSLLQFGRDIIKPQEQFGYYVAYISPRDLVSEFKEFLCKLLDLKCAFIDAETSNNISVDEIMKRASNIIIEELRGFSKRELNVVVKENLPDNLPRLNAGIIKRELITEEDLIFPPPKRR